MEFDIAFAFVPLTGWSETISPRLALLVRVQSLSRLAVAMCQLGDYIAHPSFCSSLEPSTCCNKMCSTGCSSGTTAALTLPAWFRNLYLLNRYLVATEASVHTAVHTVRLYVISAGEGRRQHCARFQLEKISAFIFPFIENFGFSLFLFPIFLSFLSSLFLDFLSVFDTQKILTNIHFGQSHS